MADEKEAVVPGDEVGEAASSPAEAPAAPAAEPAKALVLTELQHQAVQTLLWKKRALRYRVQETERMLEKHVAESRASEVEFLRMCRGFGIDVKRNFTIGEKGEVAYPGDGGKAVNPVGAGSAGVSGGK